NSTVIRFSLHTPATPPNLPSFPTRRSSDLDKSEMRRLRTARRLEISAWVSTSCLLPSIKFTAVRNEPVRGIGKELGECVGRVCRSEEHTSELQSPCNLVCRLLLEKKKYTSLLYHPIEDILFKSIFYMKFLIQ